MLGLVDGLTRAGVDLAGADLIGGTATHLIAADAAALSAFWA